MAAKKIILKKAHLRLSTDDDMLCINQTDFKDTYIYMDFIDIPDLIKALQKAKKIWWNKNDL